MSNSSIAKVLACLLMVPLLAVSCASSEKVPPGTRFVVSTPKAAFYKYGPAQSFGADFQLSQGQELTMIERSFGFSRVLTVEGVTGYISNDEIAPAPIEPPPRPVSHSAPGPIKRRTLPPLTPAFDSSDLPDSSELPVPPLPQ